MICVQVYRLSRSSIRLSLLVRLHRSACLPVLPGSLEKWGTLPLPLPLLARVCLRRTIGRYATEVQEAAT